MTTPASLYNLTARQGASFLRTFVWKDPAKKIIKLSGYAARMQIRETVESETVILELTTENERISLGQENGSISLYIPDEITQTLDHGSYVYDLELLPPGSSDVYKLIHGNFVVQKWNI